jgi:hypothetical protein
MVCMALGALLLAGGAFAQSVVQDGQGFRGVLQQQSIGGVYRADSTARMLTMSSTGGLAIYDESRDRDAWGFISKVYSDTISNATNGKQSDSTAVFYVAPYRSKSLFIHPIVHGAAGSILQVAVQVRAHYLSAADSNMTYPLTLFAAPSTPWVSNGSAGADSIGHLALANRGGATGGLMGNGEFVLILRPDVDMNSVAGRTPRGIFVPLPPVFTPYLSVRFWVIDPITSVTANYLRARLDVTFAGSPL